MIGVHQGTMCLSNPDRNRSPVPHIRSFRSSKRTPCAWEGRNGRIWGAGERFFLVPTLLRGNAYLCDEHFISSGFGEVTFFMR